MKKLISLCLTFIIAISVLVSASNVVIAKTKINKTKIILIPNSTYSLSLSGIKRGVKWYSQNKKIASVSKKGNVTAIKSGTTYVKGKYKNKTYSCKVTVRYSKIKNRKAADAFKKFLKSIKNKWSTTQKYKERDFKFACYNMAGGKIPTLVITNSNSNHAEGFVRVYQYVKGKVQKAGYFGQDSIGGLYLSKAVFRTVRTNMGISTATTFKLNENKATNLSVAYYTMSYETDKPRYTYYVKDKKVSKSKYNSYIQSITKNSIKVTDNQLKSSLKSNTVKNRDKYI